MTDLLALEARILNQLDSLLPPDVQMRFGDTAALTPRPDAASTIVIRNAEAVRRLASARSTHDLAIICVDGAIDIEGRIERVFPFVDDLLERGSGKNDRAWGSLLDWGSPTTVATDHIVTASQEGSDTATQIAFHYDRPVAFWQLWLDSHLQYTCGYYRHVDESLETAQMRTLGLLARKLCLNHDDRLLDFGCGWGGWLTFAQRHYAPYCHGITLSALQGEHAKQLLSSSGGPQTWHVEYCDFRNTSHLRQFTKLTGIGILEHVGRRLAPSYFRCAHECLSPGGLFLNCGNAPRDRIDPFIDRHAFPGGELLTVDETIRHAEAAGFEVLDVESLRDSYIQTSRAWLINLEAKEALITQLLDLRTFRTFRLTLAGFLHRFATARIDLFQILMRKRDSGSLSPHIDRSRWYGSL